MKQRIITFIILSSLALSFLLLLSTHSVLAAKPVEHCNYVLSTGRSCKPTTAISTKPRVLVPLRDPWYMPGLMDSNDGMK